MAHPGHVYHWKHGWIPLDHAAALSKAKGDHKLAGTLLANAKSPHAGIRDRQHVAKATLGLSSISDVKERSAAMQHVREQAKRIDAKESQSKASNALPIGGWESRAEMVASRSAENTYATRESHTKAIDRIKALGGEDTGSPYDAQQRYALDQYREINGYLQGTGAPRNEPRTLLDIARLDRAFAEASDTTEGINVFRRGVRPGEGFNPAEFYKEGAVIQEAGFLSMSTENPQAFAGPDGWTMYVLLPPGQRIIPGTFNEREVILDRGSTHHVVKVDPKTRTIWTQVV